MTNATEWFKWVKLECESLEKHMYSNSVKTIERQILNEKEKLKRNCLHDRQKIIRNKLGNSYLTYRSSIKGRTLN